MTESPQVDEQTALIETVGGEETAHKIQRFVGSIRISDDRILFIGISATDRIVVTSNPADFTEETQRDQALNYSPDVITDLANLDITELYPMQFPLDQFNVESSRRLEGTTHTVVLPLQRAQLPHEAVGDVETHILNGNAENGESENLLEMRYSLKEMLSIFRTGSHQIIELAAEAGGETVVGLIAPIPRRVGAHSLIVFYERRSEVDQLVNNAGLSSDKVARVALEGLRDIVLNTEEFEHFQDQFDEPSEADGALLKILQDLRILADLQEMFAAPTSLARQLPNLIDKVRAMFDEPAAVRSHIDRKHKKIAKKKGGATADTFLVASIARSEHGYQALPALGAPAKRVLTGEIISPAELESGEQVELIEAGLPTLPELDNFMGSATPHGLKVAQGLQTVWGAAVTYVRATDEKESEDALLDLGREVRRTDVFNNFQLKPNDIRLCVLSIQAMETYAAHKLRHDVARNASDDPGFDKLKKALFHPSVVLSFALNDLNTLDRRAQSTFFSDIFVVAEHVGMPLTDAFVEELMAESKKKVENRLKSYSAPEYYISMTLTFMRLWDGVAFGNMQDDQVEHARSIIRMGILSLKDRFKTAILRSGVAGSKVAHASLSLTRSQDSRQSTAEVGRQFLNLLTNNQFLQLDNSLELEFFRDIGTSLKALWVDILSDKNFERHNGSELNATSEAAAAIRMVERAHPTFIDQLRPLLDAAREDVRFNKSIGHVFDTVSAGSQPQSSDS